MKLLSLMVSLALGLAVLAALVQPWTWDASAPQESVSAGAPVAPRRQPATPTPKDRAQSDTIPSMPATPASPGAASEAQETKHLLAHEQAEALRQSSIEQHNHPINPDPPLVTKRYFNVKVRDAGTLEVESSGKTPTVITLDGIKAREADGLCTKADGSNWPCGAQARAALTRFIRGRAVTCTLPPQGEVAAFNAKCGVMEQDLATWLVRQGWALPKLNDEREFADVMEAAKSGRLGLWQAGDTP